MTSITSSADATSPTGRFSNRHNLIGDGNRPISEYRQTSIANFFSRLRPSSSPLPAGAPSIEMRHMTSDNMPLEEVVIHNADITTLAHQFPDMLVKIFNKLGDPSRNLLDINRDYAALNSVSQRFRYVLTKDYASLHVQDGFDHAHLGLALLALMKHAQNNPELYPDNMLPALPRFRNHRRSDITRAELLTRIKNRLLYNADRIQNDKTRHLLKILLQAEQKQFGLVSIDLAKLSVDNLSPLLELLKSASIDALSLAWTDSITDPLSNSLNRIAAQFALKSLTLSGWDMIRDDQLIQLLENQNLTHLDLTGCKNISSNSFERIIEQTNLKRLNLSGCTNLRSLIGLASLHQLIELDLSNGPLVLQHDLASFRLIPQLQLLNLTGCNGISNIDSLDQLACLETLDLSSTSLTNLNPLNGLAQLRSLSLKNCLHIIDTDLSALANLQQLQFLDIENCRLVTEQGLEHLRGLSQLLKVNTQGCPHIQPLHVNTLYKQTRHQSLNRLERNLDLYFFRYRLLATTVLLAAPIFVSSVLAYRAFLIGIINAVDMSESNAPNPSSSDFEAPPANYSTTFNDTEALFSAIEEYAFNNFTLSNSTDHQEPPLVEDSTVFVVVHLIAGAFGLMPTTFSRALAKILLFLVDRLIHRVLKFDPASVVMPLPAETSVE